MAASGAIAGVPMSVLQLGIGVGAGAQGAQCGKMSIKECCDTVVFEGSQGCS